MPVNILKSPNAYLSYADAVGNLRSFVLWVMEYSQPHQMRGETHQSFGYSQYYPKSYAPGVVNVRGRLKDANMQEHLGRFIREHQSRMLSQPGRANLGDSPLALMNFGIPSEGFYVAGFIKTYRVQRERFREFATEYAFDFEPIRDRHSTNSGIVPAVAMQSWWTGEVLDGRPVVTRPIDEGFTQEDLSVASELENVENIVKNPIGGIPGAGGGLLPPQD